MRSQIILTLAMGQGGRRERDGRPGADVRGAFADPARLGWKRTQLDATRRFASVFAADDTRAECPYNIHALIEPLNKLSVHPRPE